MDADLKARLSAAVPRYTSYPTAPHFHPGVDRTVYGQWLRNLPASEPVSIYVHIPYCDRLCWFCACHTKQTRRYEPVAEYLQSLHREIELVRQAIGRRLPVRAIHFGGGSPTMLKPEDIVALAASLRSVFDCLPDAEFSVEIDPNDMDEARFDALAAIGTTRASLGVQDFDQKVQTAINRDQSFEATRAVVEGVRARGVGSVNIDLLYGLPHQTVASVGATMEQALTLRPERVALFGYAHVPWFKKHQTMIDEAWLPGAEQRLAQAQRAAEIAHAAGYVPVGIDHFALPQDTLAGALASGRLRRNFQGYTVDDCPTLIGFGPSAIGRFREGHAQNIPATGEYQRMVGEDQLAVVRGIAFTADDIVRGWVIERLMCDLEFSSAEAMSLFGVGAIEVIAEADRLVDDPDKRLIRQDDRYVISPEVRPFARTVAARFDRYLGGGTARHSAAV